MTTEQLLPSIAFAILNILTFRYLMADVRGAMAHALSARGYILLVHRGVYFAFVTLMIVLFVVRPSARSRDTRASSWLLAMFGTFGLMSVPLLPSGSAVIDTGVPGALVASVISLVALCLALVTLATLRLSFSILPQARRLVTSGPYRVVRHPLYLCESMAILAGTIASGKVTVLAMGILVLACQVRRSVLEERILRKTFPEYDQQFAGIAHFLPGVY